MAIHGIYFRDTNRILANTALSTILSSCHNTPRPAAIGNEGYTPPSKPKSDPFPDTLDSNHLAFAYKGTYHKHITSDLTTNRPGAMIHPHPRGYSRHLFHTATRTA